MTAPLVSVVIPTYNQNPAFLRDAVTSALAQTYPNVEVVVSDNHSTNGAPDVLRNISSDRLRIIRPPAHIPMTEHFSFVASQATGDFISFLASDDWVHAEWLSSLMPLFLEHPEAVVGFGEIADVAHDDLSRVNFCYRDLALPTGYYPVPDLAPIMLRFDRKASWMVGDVIRADAYRASGGIGYGGFHYSSDWGLIVRLLEIGGGVYLNRVVAKYRSWGQAEGKVDSLRILGTVGDVLKAYEMLESSEALRPTVEKLRPDLVRAKQKKARAFLLELLEAVATSRIERNELNRVSDLLLKLDDSASMKMALKTCQPWLAPVLGRVYPFARSAFRSPLGRRLRGRKPVADLQI